MTRCNQALGYAINAINAERVGLTDADGRANPKAEEGTDHGQANEDPYTTQGN